MHSERIRRTISKQGIVKGYKHSDCFFQLAWQAVEGEKQAIVFYT